ncbi:MAG: flippase-like domain-containing protein [Flavobacteriales bacterium]|nr:flippase-like domain-containing protein [Flavobacteriales bacterium]MCB9363088.1 flippase-like domain-containing protein [Flavobacteriales bacterium]
MNKETIYKYFNLIFKILIGVFAFAYVVAKIRSALIQNGADLCTIKIEYSFVVMVLVLMLINWGLESYKWKWLIQEHIKISFFKAFGLVLSGITISIITPNRIGEIPGRVFLLNNTEFRKDLIWKTSFGAFSQLAVTILIGTSALYLTSEYFIEYFSNSLVIMLLIGVLILILLFIFFQKIPSLLSKIPFFNKMGSENIHLSFVEIIKLLLLSSLRYGVFCLQFWLVLKAFQIELIGNQILLIPVCFFMASIIPTMLLSEIGVRSSVAVFVFGMISDNVIAIILASLLLWIINIATPAMFGLFNLKQLTILKN